MIMFRLIAIFLSMTFLHACATKEFIVLKDVPSNPSFVVMLAGDSYKPYVSAVNNPKFVVAPFNNLMYEIEYANKIETIFINVGCNVIERPIIKEVSSKTTKEVGGQKTQVAVQAEDSSASVAVTAESAEQGAAQQNVQTERYRVGETNADYIVDTILGYKRVRIRDNKTGAIVFSWNVTESDDMMADTLYDALRNIGIAVKPNYIKQKDSEEQIVNQTEKALVEIGLNVKTRAYVQESDYVIEIYSPKAALSNKNIRIVDRKSGQILSSLGLDVASTSKEMITDILYETLKIMKMPVRGEYQYKSETYKTKYNTAAPKEQGK